MDKLTMTIILICLLLLMAGLAYIARWNYLKGRYNEACVIMFATGGFTAIIIDMLLTLLNT